MYKKILVPVDGSELAECVLPHVASIAKGCGAQTIVFVRAIEPVQMMADADGGGSFTNEDIKDIAKETRDNTENYLSQLVERTKHYGVNIQSEGLFGKAAEVIADYATNNEVDLIVISTHGRSGVSRWVWGSVANRILRSACVPVMMIRAPGCIPGI